MVDIYLSLALVIILVSLIGFYILLRFAKEYLDSYFLGRYIYIETAIFQNTKTGDVIIMKMEDMILVESGENKGLYIKKEKTYEAQYYDLIVEEK
jgi:hypothetical protein